MLKNASIVFFLIFFFSQYSYAKEFSGEAARAINASSGFPNVEVAFSPKQGAEELVLRVIDSAKESIRLAAYSFTSVNIVKALKAAKERGVDVRIVVDFKSNFSSGEGGKGSHAVSALITAGVQARHISKYTIFHHKFIIADSKTVETGSFNFSKAAAERNAENVIVVWNDSILAKSYLEKWNQYWEESDEVKLKY